jgi:hypothetical protein
MADTVRNIAVDAGGRVIRSDDLVAIPPAAACFELHAVGAQETDGFRAVVFEIQAAVRLDTYPFVFMGGTVGGDICAPLGMGWRITQGSFGQNFTLHAEFGPLASGFIERVLPGPSGCGGVLDISGEYQGPNSYKGAFGYDGEPYKWSCVTLFKGWQGC